MIVDESEWTADDLQAALSEIEDRARRVRMDVSDHEPLHRSLGSLAEDARRLRRALRAHDLMLPGGFE